MRLHHVVSIAAILLGGCANDAVPKAAMSMASPVEQRELSATIVGSGSPEYNPARAGPSVLIQYGDTRILVDMGNGAQARLQEYKIPIETLDGLFFTHQHLDHNEEFVPIFIRALVGNHTFRIAGPPPTAQIVASTLKNYDQDIRYRLGRIGLDLGVVKGNFTVTELVGGETLMIGGITVTTAAVNHSIATTALRFDAGGHSIVLSGDLVYSALLPILAKDADVLVIDSGGTIHTSNGNVDPRRDPGTGSAGLRNARAHVTLDETARMASEAGTKTLLLTHFVPGEIDEAATIAVLRKRYAGQILFGRDLMRINPSN